MKINFRGQDLELHYSLRLFIIYENIIGQGLDVSKDINSFTSILTLFYSAIVATLQYNKMELDVTYDEFIDWLDDGAADKIKEFSEWFIKNLAVQSELTDYNLNKETKTEKLTDKKISSKK